MWMRAKVTLTDGTIKYTTPVCEGVWEEIYGIYAVADKVDGALGDVTDLKSRMTTAETNITNIQSDITLSSETKQMFADEGYPIE